MLSVLLFEWNDWLLIIFQFESKSDHIKFIQAGGGLDYGSGMAHSYFYGYLNKILPDNGDDNVGIRENIEVRSFCFLKKE